MFRKSETIGHKSEGVVDASEFDSPEEIEIGKEIEVLLEETETSSGMIPLSKRKADRIRGWENIITTKKEGDTIKGKEKTTGIATHVERVSGYGIGDNLDHVTALNLKQKTVQSFARIPKDKKKTETLDNGVEFSEYEIMEKETGMQIFFAYPYHSWERGTNENFNGLLRQYFPKGTPFATITQKDVNKAVRELNHRPRKRLNYLTPHEVFVKGMRP